MFLSLQYVKGALNGRKFVIWSSCRLSSSCKVPELRLLATVDTSLVAVHVSGAKARLPAAADRQKCVALGTRGHGSCVYFGTSASKNFKVTITKLINHRTDGSYMSLTLLYYSSPYYLLLALVISPTATPTPLKISPRASRQHPTTYPKLSSSHYFYTHHL